MEITEDIMEFLRQVKRLQVLFDKALEKYKKAESRLYAISIQIPNDTRIQKSRDPHSMEQRIADVEVLRGKAADQLYRLTCARNDVISTIHLLDDVGSIHVLAGRYAFCETWATIAKNAGKTERWAYRVHDKALRDLKEITTGQELRLY